MKSVVAESGVEEMRWSASPTPAGVEHAGPDITRRARVAEPEGATLAALRDMLLPPLIWGEVRVRDAEELVPAVT
ncbi:MAG: hypothetical protein ACYCYA_05835 [Actinomycetes bacterium]